MEKIKQNILPYILATVHTIYILYNLFISFDNIKYIIDWSKSYFIFDSIVSSKFIIDDLIANIRYNKPLLNVRTSYVGYLVHHFIAYNFLSIYSDIDSNIKKDSQIDFYEILRSLEVSNIFLYLTYFIYERFGKKHLYSKLSLLLETGVYGYIRSYMLGKFILNNGYNLNGYVLSQLLLLYGSKYILE